MKRLKQSVGRTKDKEKKSKAEKTQPKESSRTSSTPNSPAKGSTTKARSIPKADEGTTKKQHAIRVNSSDSEADSEDKGSDEEDDNASTQSDSGDENNGTSVELILLNTPSVEQEELEELLGCEIKHLECFGRSEGKRTNVVKFEVGNARIAKKAKRRIAKLNTTADLQYYQGVAYERLRSIPVTGWNPQHINNWAGLLEDIKSVVLRRYPDLVVLDVNVFPGKQFGNITLRDVAMAENFVPFKTNFVGIEFSFKARDNLVIKGVAEGVIEGLQLQDMDQVKTFLEDEVGPLVRFEAVKKGTRNLVVFGFDNYAMSERVIEGEVIVKVARREVRGGMVKPSMYWAKQYITDPPSNKKDTDSPTKAKDNDRAVDSVSSTRLAALDRQRIEDYRVVRDDLEKGLKEQADRTIDLINHQRRETTKAFSNTMVSMNQRNYEVMILMQEVNRLERKLAMAETSVTLYRAMQNENMERLIPEIESNIKKLEEELKVAEAELKAVNTKPLEIPEFTPLNKSSMMISCANEDSPMKKYEKPEKRKRKTTEKKKEDDEDNETTDLVDHIAVKRWSAVVSGKEPGMYAFAAKAMWVRDVEPLLKVDFRNDRPKVVDVIATLAAFTQVFGNDCKEGKMAEAKINEFIANL